MINLAPLSLVHENYSTYCSEITGEPESHAIRLLAQLAIAIAAGIFLSPLSDDAVAVFITATSILIGFAFSSLFPISSDGVSGLADPKFSEDWNDLDTIRKLSKNFRSNVNYFIPLSLLVIGLLAFQMLDFSAPSGIESSLNTLSRGVCTRVPSVCWAADQFPVAIQAVTLFCLFEMIYTFYRLSFSALSLLRIKDEYREERFEADRRDRSGF